ncbi:unnamed protein product [Cochlearia groenlandica]
MSKEQEWIESISLTSSSRCSSITSASSDGHFDIRHFPLPKPVLSASQTQKQRETHEAYNSSLHSSCSTVNRINLVDLPGYDPNRIPSSVFSSKPVNSTEWSIASNESLFSIHDGNFRISTCERYGFDPELKLSEIPRFEESVQVITETKPVKKQELHEVYDNQQVVEYVKKEKDSNITPSHSLTISCPSNTSICSFAFAGLQKEERVMETPSRGNVSYKQEEYMLPLSHMQPQYYSECKAQIQLQTQRKASKQFKYITKSTKRSRNGWFSCFHFNSKRRLFKY